MILLLSTHALAAEMLLTPGGISTDDFAATDQIAWLDYDTDCAGQVLELPDKAELPVQITAIRLAFTSSSGAYDHHYSSVAVGLTLLEDGAEPTGLPGISTWDWTETWFTVAVSSQHLNEISLTNLKPPTWPLTMEGGRLAVWVCPTDPEEALAWQRDDDAGVLAGLLIDSDLPGDSSYLWSAPELHRLSDLGVEGGWVIQAVAEDERVVATELLSLAGISPGSSPLGEVAEVELSGTAFTDQLSGFIGGLAIAALEVVDGETLSGRSPSGLPVGLHDVSLVDAAGEEALLTSSFEVLAVEELPSEADTGGKDSGSVGAGAEEGGAEEGGAAPDGGCGCGGTASAGPWVLSLLFLVRRRRDSA